MAKRTASEIYAALTGAGFTPPAAAVMTAIALAESGGDDTALGDVRLQDNVWGPSYGLFQVRTVKGQTGQGSSRDINWLAGSIENQARAAYQISSGGRDFTPWTQYTNGKYTSFLGQAEAAAGGAAAGLAGQLPGLVGGAASGAAGQALAGAHTIVVEGVFVVLGVGLVVAGLVRAFHPMARAGGELRREGDRATAAAAVVK